MSPLYSLLKKEAKWKWGDSENTAFTQVKEALCDRAMLAHYNRSKPVTLQVDASAVGLGAVLLQEQPEGGILPVAYASRKLKPAETRYAQIEREALAIVFGVTRFNQYLLGRFFTIMSDHKPLLSVLAKDKSVPIQVSTRLKKWAFTVSHLRLQAVLHCW